MAKTSTEQVGKPAKLPEPAIKRFKTMLDLLLTGEERIGVAVSGGADSLALLLLAAAARPGAVEAATVDHGLREGSLKEAQNVAELCATIGVPHEILTLEWKKIPATAIPEQARIRRYGALAEWAKTRKLKALCTGHHADDQAETLLMRLNRGAGVNGLAGMRYSVRIPGSDEALVRPLLGWRHEELERLCAAAGVTPADDPSNDDEAFERVRMRKALADADWLDAAAVAESASHLADGDRALTWAADREWGRAVSKEGDRIVLDPAGLPREIRRRLLLRAVSSLASQGGSAIRGRQSNRLLAALAEGKKATLRGVLCGGGERWTFEKAPARAVKTPA